MWESEKAELHQLRLEVKENVRDEGTREMKRSSNILYQNSKMK